MRPGAAKIDYTGQARKSNRRLLRADRGGKYPNLPICSSATWVTCRHEKPSASGRFVSYVSIEEPLVPNGYPTMLEAGWLQVLQRIRPENLDNVSLISVTGAELVIQQVFRLEHDFVVVRARTAGTMDTGRCIVVPFSQIDFLAFNKKMSEEEVMKLFDGPFQAVAPVAMVAAGAPVSAPTPLPAPVMPPILPKPAAKPVETPEPEPAAAEEAPADPNKPNHPSKTVLLARLRERLAAK
jgi:hypothetical protein